MLGSGARLVPGFVMKGDSIAGRYRVDRVLGTGASGFVAAARHIQTREKVGLKVLTNGAEPPGLALPASPHIARVIETGYTIERQGFIASELLEGQSLAQLLEASGPLSTRFAVSVVRQACAGLAAAHAAGIAHGDLKLQNLFLTTDGVVKVLDFGMVMPLVEDTDQESSAAWLASPAYLAPEQLREATFGPAADVWALGVILHELIAGSLPFDAETIAGMFVAVAYDTPKMLAGADVPYELACVVQACLAKTPAERPTVEALRARLAPFAPTESVPPPMTMTIESEPDLEATPISSGSFLAVSAPSAPPPLPPRVSVPLSRRLRERADRGWRKARLAARIVVQTLAPAARTPSERDFQRRRWGAIGVVVAAGVLAVASAFASPAASAAAPAAEPEPVEVVEVPLTFGLGAFVPPSYALPERQRQEKEVEPRGDRRPSPALALPMRWPRPPRARLLVREDPYGHAGRPSVVGFTHPRRLPERHAR